MSNIKITAADVKKLRDITGAGMMDCKKALAESSGDYEKAIEFLRKKGQKRIIVSFRATGEGHISSIVFRSGIIDEDNNELVLNMPDIFL